MGLFSRYDREPAQPAKPAQAPPEAGARGPAKKAIPTPTRRAAEQARRERIQPVLTKKQVKQKQREAEYKMRDEAMAKTHAKPYNVMIRDWIDRRWNIAEFILPVMILFFVGTIVAAQFWPAVMMYGTYGIWIIVGLLILDTFWMWIGLRQQLRTYFPDEAFKGKFSYALSRMMLMRRSRIPAPRVKRGTSFVWPNPGDRR